MDIEDSMEKYYRNMAADDILDCLYSSPSSDPGEQQQVYWFNQGMQLAAMIARYGFNSSNTENIL